MTRKETETTTDFVLTDLVSVLAQALRFLDAQGLTPDQVKSLHIAIGAKQSDGAYEVELYEP